MINPKVCVVGSGAVGSVVAARLSSVSSNVHLVSRKGGGEHLIKNGLTLVSSRGDYYAENLSIVDDTGGLGPQDIVILAVKAHQVLDTVESLFPLIGSSTSLVTMQNGIPFWYFYGLRKKFGFEYLESVDPAGKIYVKISHLNIIGAVLYLAAEMESPCKVRLLEDSLLPLGEIRGNFKTTRVVNICDLFKNSGFNCQISQNIRDEVWLKLWGNCTFNPVSVLTSQTLAEICNSTEGNLLINVLMNEVKKVGEQYGAKFKITVAQKIEAAKKVGHHNTSTLQDIRNKKKTEIDALLGSIIELASIADVPVSNLRTIYTCCRLLEEKVLKLNKSENV
ncbi:MAG: hypothetical protein CBC42_06770 [Betaproteobacteria bacterium TMED82]|nr:MAG: hypothetical protein CBC42_06770 [Betaproteobacteria bacterium TMED82]